MATERVVWLFCLVVYLGWTPSLALETPSQGLLDFDPRFETFPDFTVRKLRTTDNLLDVIADALLQSDLLTSPEILVEISQFLGVLEEMSFAEDNSTDPNLICAGCKATIIVLKRLASEYEWEEIEEPIIDLCIELGHNITNITGIYIDGETLCPGIVQLQGPHIFEVVRPVHRKDPVTYCEFLNLCFPPKPLSHLRVAAVGAAGKTEHPPPKIHPHRAAGKDYEARKRASIKLVQLTDVHIEPKYEENTSTSCGLPVCCIPENGPGDAPAWGYYSCNIPTQTMEFYFRWVAQQNPDFVIYSGDTPPHAMWHETYHSQLNCTLTLLEALETYLSNYTVYPSIGNHEMYPTNLFSFTHLPDYSPPLSAEFAEHWTKAANFTEEQQETMRAGGYYSAVVRPGLRIITFNSNYWYSFNWYNVLLEDEDEVTVMEEFVRDEFEQARTNNEKVVLVCHHPPGNIDAVVSITRRFEQLVLNYSDILVLHVSGHTHYDEYRVLSDADGMPVAVHLVAPPMTTFTNRNPSARIHYLDSETFELLDYEQFNFDVQDTFLQGKAEPEIKLVYSAKDEYNMADLSPASWRDLTTRMESDPDLLNTYHLNRHSRYYNTSPCEEACARRLLCHTQSYSYDNIARCEAEENEQRPLET